MADRETVDVHEAAEITGLSAAAVRRYISEGRLDGGKSEGRLYVYKAAAESYQRRKHAKAVQTIPAVEEAGGYVEERAYIHNLVASIVGDRLTVRFTGWQDNPYGHRCQWVPATGKTMEIPVSDIHRAARYGFFEYARLITFIRPLQNRRAWGTEALYWYTLHRLAHHIAGDGHGDEFRKAYTTLIRRVPFEATTEA